MANNFDEYSLSTKFDPKPWALPYKFFMQYKIHTVIMLISAVDTETDANIRNALANREKKATTIIISHRATTLMEADRILVLKDGKLSQLGSHEELLREDGIYSRIWNIQSLLEEELMEKEAE